MSLTTYPIVLFPDAIRQRLLRTKPQKKPVLLKLKAHPSFAPPARIKVFSLSRIEQISKWVCWLQLSLNGCIAFALLASLVNGESKNLATGLMLLLHLNALFVAALQFLQQLKEAQRRDRTAAEDRYWGVNQKANQVYIERVPQMVHQQYREARPQLKLCERRSKQSDWQHVFERGLAKEEAQKGVSEKFFLKYLQQYFPDCQITTDYFALTDEIGYTTDFSLITPDGSWGFDLEIDEPYDGYSKMPHHCQDNSKDRDRNYYLLQRGWIVLRFSEYQIVHYPDSCCKTIAAVLNRLGVDVYLEAFSNVGDLSEDATWTSGSVKQMIARKYREIYLDKAGLFRFDAQREKRNAQAVAKEKKQQARTKRRKRSIRRKSA